ncbi:hypothetical protein [Methylobacterium isbiliense]|nr:hypothetical protein [Methylobacterium isbiliense]MDN3623951.1 hypothetical protein [Methylobacterium isbiliense]
MRAAPASPRAGMMRISMLDVLLLAAGLGFFALSLGYVALCERL